MSAADEILATVRMRDRRGAAGLPRQSDHEQEPGRCEHSNWNGGTQSCDHCGSSLEDIYFGRIQPGCIELPDLVA